MKNASRAACWLGLVFLTLFSCKKDYKAKPLPPELGNYVAAFTTGTISRTADIQVRFVAPVVGEDQIGKEVASGIFQIKPAVKGKATWTDNQTLNFLPETHLPSGTAYLVKIRLDKLFNKLPENLQSFEFDLRTRDMFVDLQVDGLEAADLADLSMQKMVGTLGTSDQSDPKDAEASLEATQNGKKLSIRWMHDPGLTRHNFVIEGVTRGKKDGSVTIHFNGAPLSTSQKETLEVEVPALGNFKVTDARVIQQEEQYISLRFSDPLHSQQELEGLVRIPSFDGYLRFVINGNELRAYPSTRLTGTHQILIEPGIKNIQNTRMPNPSNWTLEFEQTKPGVRLVGRGVIMPNSSGLAFPFEAISLNAVEVEVFQIYQNNILQFLQNNELDGTWEMERVGRVILQKKIPLQQLNPQSNPNTWTRYALELGELFSQDPNSVYQIRIGFRPSYSTFNCGGSHSNQENALNLRQVDKNLDARGEIVSFWDDWYGIEGYYEDYDWSHREDPCKPAYYNSDNFIRRNVLATNFGLTAKKGNDGEIFIAASDLRTTDPVAGATVDFYDFQQQLIKSMQTDGQGIAKTTLSRSPFMVIATKGQDKGYLKMGDGNALSLSKFDVAGVEVQKGIKGFIYGERGVWRPGDTLFLHFILEDDQKKLPENHPIVFELTDSRGQLQKRMASTSQVEGIYPLTTPTNANAPTGNWMAKVEVGGAVFTKVLKVETVKPNRLKVHLDFGKKELGPGDNDLKGNLQVKWLHGAPARNLQTVVEMQIRAVRAEFPKYPEFVFEDPARSTDPEPRVIFDQKLDANGQAKLQAKILENKEVPGKLQLRFKSRAFENSGNFSTDVFTLPYIPFQALAGVALPKNQWGQTRMDLEKEGTISFMSLDPAGKPIANRKLEAGLYRLDWDWWWDADNRNVSKFNSTNHFNALSKITLQTGNNGMVNWPLTINEYGRYLVRVCDTESGHCAGNFFYAGYSWYDDENNTARSEASMLTFAADKESYQLGETITLKVPAGEIGRVLLTLESGSKVLESYWKDAKAGENTFSFEATKEMVPTVYAHVSLIQPHGQTKNDLPIRMYGVVPIEVQDPKTLLQPKLSMPEVLQPEQEVTLKVSESSGNPMAYTIAMVDEGLLDLTRFKTPNPHEAFYAREALGVKTWDVYDYVLGAYGGELERLLSIGGDGEIQPGDAKRNANRFVPVVKHLGPFFLKKGQTASHKLVMPNYVGSVRTMVIAAKDGAYGAVEKTTPVRKPLMVLGTLPRVIGPGETLRLPVNVFAMESKVRQVQVTLNETSGLVKIAGANQKELSFPKPGEEMVYFDLQVGNRTGIAKFEILAEGNGEKASQRIEIDLRNPNPLQSAVIEGMAEPNQSWETTFRPFGTAGTSKALLEVSTIPSLNLEKRLKYLLQYPYGCIEQTISTGFPQLYVGQFLEMDEVKKNQATRHVTATIEKLKNFQRSDGSFAYWPGSDYNNPWANTYAGHFLVEAKKAGYAVSEGMLNNWLSNQKKAARAWDPEQEKLGFYGYRNSQLSQAYRLYALALAGSPEMGAMNRLREMDKLNADARWRLAAAYATAGKREVAAALTKNLTTEVMDYRELSYTFGSSVRDKALILETLVLTGERNQAAEVLKSVASSLGNEQWLSTQDIAYSLLSIGKFAGANPMGEKMTFDFKIGTKPTIQAGTPKPLMQIEIPINGQQEQQVAISNTGKSVLFARIILTGQPQPGEEKSEQQKMELAVQYRGLDGKPISVENLPQGTDFIAEVMVTHTGIFTGTLKELALSQIFPSGWEITNSRLDGMEAFNNATVPTYQDIRDDRVQTFFDLSKGKSATFRIMLNAAYPGRYYLPSVQCEAMYDASIYARKAGKWVEVRQGSEETM